MTHGCIALGGGGVRSAAHIRSGFFKFGGNEDAKQGAVGQVQY